MYNCKSRQFSSLFFDSFCFMWSVADFSGLEYQWNMDEQYMQADFWALFPVIKNCQYLTLLDISYMFYVVSSRLPKSFSCDCILRSWGLFFVLFAFYASSLSIKRNLGFLLLIYWRVVCEVPSIDFFFLFVQLWITVVALLDQMFYYFYFLLHSVYRYFMMIVYK